jgi:hypothetical protein
MSKEIDQLNGRIKKLRDALDVIANAEPGSRRAYKKFEQARWTAKEALREDSDPLHTEDCATHQGGE